MTKTSRMFLPVAAGLSLIVLSACRGSGADEPAALSQIDDQLWENMQAADSVTITIEPQETDQAVDDSDTDGLFDGMFGVFDETIQIYGDVEGAAMAIALEDEDMMLVFDQTEGYLAADALFKLFGGEDPPAGFSDSARQAAIEEFSDTWLDYSAELENAQDDISISALLDEFHNHWVDGDTDGIPVTRDNLSDEGTRETREDQDVLVYEGSEDGQELVVEADSDAPKIMSISDRNHAVIFSDWDQTDSPERPDASEVIDEDDLQDRILDFMTR